MKTGLFCGGNFAEIFLRKIHGALLQGSFGGLFWGHEMTAHDSGTLFVHDSFDAHKSLCYRRFEMMAFGSLALFLLMAL